MTSNFYLGGEIVTGETVTHTYSYDDADWADLLTAYDGHSLTYDAIGNPLTYYNGSSYSMTWARGRRLASVSRGSSSASYAYDMDGIRTSKTVNGVTTEFITQNGRVVRQSWSGNVLDFFYDSQQHPYAVTYKPADGAAATYYYITNLQGDVVALIDSSGSLAAEYTYNAWGAPLTMPYGGAGAGAVWPPIAELNPLRYRGYYYDAETGFYYLQSRYYDPKIGRFINADSQLDTAISSGLNLFSYCENNPVNMADPTSHWPKLSQIFTAVAVAAVVVAAVAATVVTCGAAAPALAAVGGGIISAGAAATATTVATGALITAGVATTAAIVTSVVENTSYRGPTRNQSVYVMRDKSTGDVQYIGQTNNPIRRQSEHEKDPKKANLQPLEVKFSGLTRFEARAMEQALISAYSLENLINARREIATGNVGGFAGKIGNIISIFDGVVEDELLNLMGR